MISTSLFGSAPWSPEPLTVEVEAHSDTVPLELTRPVRFRRPPVAGAHGQAGPTVGGVHPGRVPVAQAVRDDAVGRAEVKTVLQHVIQLPLAGRRIERPLLQSSGRRGGGGGVRVRRGVVGVVASTLVGNVERRRVCEPQAEGVVRRVRRALGDGGREAFQDVGVRRGQARVLAGQAKCRVTGAVGRGRPAREARQRSPKSRGDRRRWSWSTTRWGRRSRRCRRRCCPSPW